MAASAPAAGSSLHSKTLLKSEQLYQVNQTLPLHSNQIKSPRARNSLDRFSHSRHMPISPTPSLRRQYILESTVFPREPDCLRELRVATASHPM